MVCNVQFVFDYMVISATVECESEANAVDMAAYDIEYFHGVPKHVMDGADYVTVNGEEWDD